MSLHLLTHQEKRRSAATLTGREHALARRSLPALLKAGAAEWSRNKASPDVEISWQDVSSPFGAAVSKVKYRRITHPTDAESRTGPEGGSRQPRHGFRTESRGRPGRKRFSAGTTRLQTIGTRE